MIKKLRKNDKRIRAVCKNPHCMMTALLRAKKESLMTEEELKNK